MFPSFRAQPQSGFLPEIPRSLLADGVGEAIRTGGTALKVFCPRGDHKEMIRTKFSKGKTKNDSRDAMLNQSAGLGHAVGPSWESLPFPEDAART